MAVPLKSGVRTWCPQSQIFFNIKMNEYGYQKEGDKIIIYQVFLEY